jgi:hypothetical protein
MAMSESVSHGRMIGSAPECTDKNLATFPCGSILTPYETKGGLMATSFGLPDLCAIGSAGGISQWKMSRWVFHSPVACHFQITMYLPELRSVPSGVAP